MALDRRRVAALASIGLGLCVLVAVACGPGNLNDLTSGLNRSDSGTTLATCAGVTRAIAPANDTSASNVGGEGTDLTFAMSDIRIDGNTAYTDASLPPPTGFDLDDNCTCGPDKKRSCFPFDAGSNAASVISDCDGDGGADNVTAALLGNLVDLVPSLQPTLLSKRIHDGIYSMLFDVIQWNGNANDPQVIVTLRMSNGIDNGTDPNTGGQAAPNFDGNDYWAVDPASISDAASVTGTGQRCDPGLGICNALANDSAGYVVNNTLVAHWDKVNLALNVSGSGSLQVPYLGVTLVAQISKDPNTGGYKLAGQMGGRWRSDDILSGAGALGGETDADAPNAILSLCGLGYTAFKQQVCSDSDLAPTPSQDNANPAVQCGALSQAMRFEAIKANAGTVHASTSNLAACGGHEGDSCEKSH